MSEPTGPPARPIRVLLVDDHALVRAGFRMLLEGEPDIEVVGEAEDGDRVLVAVTQTRPDVVLMDVQMPRVDGITATRRLADLPLEPLPRVLILTTFERDDYIQDALRAGASGFLLKNAPPEDLLQAIHVVAAGDALLAPSVTRRMIERWLDAPVAPETERPVELTQLTEREVEVLALLARGRSNAEIADHMVISATTVKTHVSNLLGKLGLRDRIQAVVYAYEHGVVRPGQQD
jgi:DNA-binding NarL/FixJ family response regulator